MAYFDAMPCNMQGTDFGSLNRSVELGVAQFLCHSLCSSVELRLVKLACLLLSSPPRPDRKRVVALPEETPNGAPKISPRPLISRG